MTAATLNTIGIDIESFCAKKAIRAIGRWVSTVAVEYRGAYREDPSYSQLSVTTSLTESELEKRLDGVADILYVGLFEIK